MSLQQETIRPVLVVNSTEKQLSVTEDDGLVSPDDSVLWGRLKNPETLNNLQPQYRHFSKERRIERSALIKEYLCLFNDIPTLVGHKIAQSGRAQY